MAEKAGTFFWAGIFTKQNSNPLLLKAHQGLGELNRTRGRLDMCHVLVIVLSDVSSLEDS